jgi:Domain of unknown function (DUF4333)
MTQQPAPTPPAGGSQPPYPPPPPYGGSQYAPPPYAPPPYAPPPVAPAPRPAADAGPAAAPPPQPAQAPWGPAQPPYGTAPGSTAPYGTAPPYGGAPSGAWPPGAPAEPPRRRRTGLIIGIVVGGIVVLAALAVGAVLVFGSTTLDSGKAQSAIAQGTQKQFGVAPTDVHCPSGIAAKAGSTFTCTAKLQGQPISFTVRQSDDKGNVTWHSDANIAPVSQVQDAVAKQVGDQAGVSATATCETGGRTLLVGATTSPVRCTVTNASDPTDSIQVDASVDAQGRVTYQQVG